MWIRRLAIPWSWAARPSASSGLPSATSDLAKGKSRYEIQEKLGAGGMGVVYRAYDKVLKADVALKTLRDISDPAALSLFRGECDKLAKIVHPNIIEIRDIGELEDGGVKKPFLVMPLLRGSTLAQLIAASSQGWVLERFVDIITQTCRGLQAAHEHGLIHRDLKPSNIFVLDDDSVKIIDFGVAHRLEGTRTMGRKGTLLYMSPEQIQMKPLSPASDIFSLGVVCYEALTRRRPFERPTDVEAVDAILHYVPAAVSEINQKVPYAISQVVHKAMAKQPARRFASAREFGETLRKALHNEPIAMFNPARLRPRLERAKAAFDKADYQFASEILAELEDEGHLDPAIPQLRRQVDGALRQARITELLKSARSRIEAGEDPLALQKIQEVLEIEPHHADALALKNRIERGRNGEIAERCVSGDAERRRDLEQDRPVTGEPEGVVDTPSLVEYFKRVESIAGRYQGAEFSASGGWLRQRLRRLMQSRGESAFDMAEPALRERVVAWLRHAWTVSCALVQRIHIHAPLHWLLPASAVLLLVMAVTVKIVSQKLPRPVSAPKHGIRETTSSPAPAITPPEPQAPPGLSGSENATANDAVPEPVQQSQPVREAAAGNLLVRTNQDGVSVQILLNGKLIRSGVTHGHQIYFRGLAAKAYAVQVSKEGFHPVDERRVEIRKGENEQLSFEMAPIPLLASVVIRCLPGAELSLDGTRIGTVASDGAFQVSGVSPGSHVFEASREQYLSKSITVQLIAGNNPPIELNLERVPIVRPALPSLGLPPPSLSPMSFWQPNAWTEQDGWYVHTGGGFLKYGRLPTGGTITFRAGWSKSGLFTKGRLEWFLNYLDDQNYLLFAIDGSGFESFRVEAGRKTPHRRKVSLKKQDAYTIQIDVRPEFVIHSVLQDGKWRPVEQWSQTGLDFTQGNFGFHIPKNNSLWLKDFAFDAR